MVIRRHLRNFERLANCTVIEGSLSITFIGAGTPGSPGSPKVLDRYSFPQLREITGYLMLYRVDGVKSLRDLFPNLTVIRGQELFHNFALVVYMMSDLEELGLVNLRVIMRGAARITLNAKLCYVDTVDWERIAIGVEYSSHRFMDNKDPSQCVNYCPEECVQTVVDGVKAKRCWSAKDCQKNLSELIFLLHSV